MTPNQNRAAFTVFFIQFISMNGNAEITVPIKYDHSGNRTDLYPLPQFRPESSHDLQNYQQQHTRIQQALQRFNQVCFFFLNPTLLRFENSCF